MYIIEETNIKYRYVRENQKMKDRYATIKASNGSLF